MIGPTHAFAAPVPHWRPRRPSPLPCPPRVAPRPLICRLAVVGFLATDFGITAPGAPTGLSSVAAHDVAVDKGAMFVLLFAASVIEVCAGVPAVEQMMKGSDRAPGDFSFGACDCAHTRVHARPCAVRSRGTALHALALTRSLPVCYPHLAQTRLTSARTRPRPRSFS